MMHRGQTAAASLRSCGLAEEAIARPVQERMEQPRKAQGYLLYIREEMWDSLGNGARRGTESWI